jgi:D-tyrosyl-tRNA(Tyr) deacylase
VFVAIHREDTEDVPERLAEKVINLRIFEKETDKMELSVQDKGGEILVVSQFTLYGDCRKGNRPSFIESAPPEKARPFYEKFIQLLEKKGAKVESGRFGKMMEVNSSNDGPVTLEIEM